MNASALKDFVSVPQLSVMVSNCAGEEGEYFKDKINEMASLVNNMPKVYEQDGMGDEAVVSLHYFLGTFDWFITEKDSEAGEKQYQAFGFADMGCPELGYISIEEIISNGGELDLHFEPRTLAQVKKDYNY